jgi:hypothetical protein
VLRKVTGAVKENKGVMGTRIHVNNHKNQKKSRRYLTKGRDLTKGLVFAHIASAQSRHSTILVRVESHDNSARIKPAKKQKSTSGAEARDENARLSAGLNPALQRFRRLSADCLAACYGADY